MDNLFNNYLPTTMENQKEVKKVAFRLPHILTKFIKEVVNYLTLFYNDLPQEVKDGRTIYYWSKIYEKVPLAIWNFLGEYLDKFQIIEYVKKENFCRCIESFSFGKIIRFKNKDNSPLKYNPSTYTEWLTKLLYETQSHYEIHVTNTIIPAKEWYLITTKTDAPYLAFFGCMNVMRYIFGYFEIGFFYLDKKNNIYSHELHMTKAQYLRCLNIFPMWTIYVHKSWRKKIKKILKLYILVDVSNICLSYLRFSNNDCKPVYTSN